MKRIFYIFLFIVAFHSYSNAQVRSSQEPNETAKLIKFYPNPATSFINFEFENTSDNSYSLLIFNFIGKKVDELKVTDNKMTVSLNNYYRGVYVFQLRDKQGNIIKTGKFQVVK